VAAAADLQQLSTPGAGTTCESLPLTHFVRIICGVMLHGVAWHRICPEAIAIAAFMAVVGTIAMLRYRQTIVWRAGLARYLTFVLPLGRSPSEYGFDRTTMS
jgi:hypothetical protein